LGRDRERAENMYRKGKEFVTAAKHKKELRLSPQLPSGISGLQSHQAALYTRNSSRMRADESPVKPSCIQLAPPPLSALLSSSRRETIPLKQSVAAPSFPNPNLKTPSKAFQRTQRQVVVPAPPKKHCCRSQRPSLNLEGSIWTAGTG